MIQIPHPRTGDLSPVATSWAELTLGQARYLLDNDAEADTFGVLAALFTPRATRVEVMNLGEQHVEALLAALAFLATPVPAFEQVPDVVRLLNFDGEPVSVSIPRDLKLGTFGQATDLGQSIEQLADDVPALRVRTLAIYLMPQLLGSKFPAHYDSDLLAATELLVAAVPLAEAVPICDFFLPLSSRLYGNTASGYSSASSHPKNSEPGSPSSASVGTLTRLLTRWPGATNLKSRLFSGNPGGK